MGFEATPERDRLYLQLADSWADEIKVICAESILDLGALAGLIRHGTVSKPIPIPDKILRAIGVEPPAGVFLTLETYDEEIPGGAGLSDEGDIFLILSLMPEAADLRAIAYVLREARTDPRLQPRAEVFLRRMYEAVENHFEYHRALLIHEITHVFDYYRSKFLLGDSGPSSVKTHADYLKYINTPAEYNAHFQELLSDIDFSLSRMTESASRDALNRFSDFLELAERTAVGTRFLPAVRGKYENKTLARLWQHWQMRREAAGIKNKRKFPL